MSAFLLGLPGKLKLLLDRLTAVRAAYLDILNGSLLQAPTTALQTPTETTIAGLTGNFDIITWSIVGTKFSFSSATLSSIVNITGSGVLQFCAVGGGNKSAPTTNYLEIWIDGILVSTIQGSTYNITLCVGCLHTDVTGALDHIPFKSSLEIKARSNGSNTLYAVVKYRVN